MAIRYLHNLDDMMKTKKRSFPYWILVLLGALMVSSAAVLKKQKPTLWIVGDSTVKNGSGKGSDGLWGWGDWIHEEFDTMRIHIANRARGGRSSRTYQTEGLWDEVLAQVKPGDFVMMQFGHNDGGNINDDHRARGTIKGVGEETEEIDNMITGKHEIVHSYGWYMRKYIDDTKAKGATPIVLSLVARNVWEDGKVVRAQGSYASWAEAAAKSEGAFYIDLNDIVATHYEKLGPEAVKKDLFLEDHTHTTLAGAKINARAVVEGLNGIPNCPLNKYLKKEFRK